MCSAGARESEGGKFRGQGEQYTGRGKVESQP
jgi:hypothetical protein